MFCQSGLDLSIMKTPLYIANFVAQPTLTNSECVIAPNKIYKIYLHCVAQPRCKLQVETKDMQTANLVVNQETLFILACTKG
jgi:hypothetical protein